MIHHTPKYSYGFSVAILLVVFIVIGGIGSAGYYLWHKNQSGTTSSSISAVTHSAETNKKQEAQSDPYQGWATYSNSTYGISFKYPTDWKTDEAEGTTDPATTNAPITTRFAANLKRNEEAKYNNTASVEVLNQDLAVATSWYDSYFDNPSNKVTKTSDDLKGKQSVQYVVVNHDLTEKVYLFSVGNKTYVFFSLNNELNNQLDSNYWPKFDKVFGSLRFN